MRSYMKSWIARTWAPRGPIARLFAVLAFAGMAAACSDSSGPQRLATLTITPASATLVANGTQQFTVVGTDDEGDAVTIDAEVWSVANPVAGTINSSTGQFTAGTTAGTFTDAVVVTCNGITARATIIVSAGPAAQIVVAPDTTLLVGATAQFRAVIRDANGNLLTVTPVWSTDNPPGTIVATTGLFTAGNTVGSFPNSVEACIPATTICDQADVTVISPPAPPAISGFTVLAFAAVTCTDGSIIGEVGTDRTSTEVPPGSITQSTCPISSGTAQVGTPAAKTAFSDFVTTYNSLATEPCGVVLTGTLAGVNLPPGVYCFDAGASPTGTLTLTGTSTDTWLFKIGTTGTGGLTPGLFTVVMAGTSQACNVTWWVQQAASITDSDFNGSVLAGAGITLTRGSFHGNAWAGASATGGDVTITGPLDTAVTGCP